MMRTAWLMGVFVFGVTSSWSQHKPVLVAQDGAWCWFGNPKAVFKNDVVHFGYVRSDDGRVALGAYEPSRGLATLLWTSGMSQRDDHNNPGLLDLSDHRMLAAYAKHGSERQFYFRVSSPTERGAARGWGPELWFTNTTAGVTYANPVQLRGEANRVYLFMRNLNHNPTFTVSDASATNWSAPRILVKTGQGRTRPYVQYCSDGDTRIDMIYTDGHPLSIPNSLYHVYYEAGVLRRSDGSALKDLGSAPLLHDDGERGMPIYQFGASPGRDYHERIAGGRAWCWDLVYGTRKQPVAVFTVQKTNVMSSDWDGDRIYYYYARWTGKTWQKRFIAHAGRPLYESERDYAGGITIDPGDPNVVYLSSNAAEPFRTKDIHNVLLKQDARYELYRGVTRDGGKTFRWEQITRDSGSDNLRPYVPRGNTFPVGVLWMSGQYRAYTDWSTGIYALFSKRLSRTSMNHVPR